MKIAALGREGFRVEITMTTEENATKLFDALSNLAVELNWFVKYDEPPVQYRMATASIADNLSAHYARCQLQHVPGTICKGCGWSEKVDPETIPDMCYECDRPLGTERDEIICWNCGFEYAVEYAPGQSGYNHQYPTEHCPRCSAAKDDE